jgi:hypothetical protein
MIVERDVPKISSQKHDVIHKMVHRSKQTVHFPLSASQPHLCSEPHSKTQLLIFTRNSMAWESSLRIL